MFKTQLECIKSLIQLQSKISYIIVIIIIIQYQTQKLENREKITTNMLTEYFVKIITYFRERKCATNHTVHLVKMLPLLKLSVPARSIFGTAATHHVAPRKQIRSSRC